MQIHRPPGPALHPSLAEAQMESQTVLTESARLISRSRGGELPVRPRGEAALSSGRSAFFHSPMGASRCWRGAWGDLVAGSAGRSVLPNGERGAAPASLNDQRLRTRSGHLKRAAKPTKLSRDLEIREVTDAILFGFVTVAR